MKADFAIDNMPKDAKPMYDCAVDATPYVFKPGKDCDGCFTEAKKDKGTKRRYTVPLYPITEKILKQINHCLWLFRVNGYWMKGIVMCIQGKKIGLACHDPRLRQKKKMTSEEKALLKRVRGASSRRPAMRIPDEKAGKVMEDCQKIVKDNQSNLNPKGVIKWISSGDLPFSSIRMDGVFTPEHLLQIGKLLTKNRQ